MGVDAWALTLSIVVAIGSTAGGFWNAHQARKALSAAEEARAGADSLEVSLQRIAEIMSRREPAAARGSAAAEPTVAFNIEYVRGALYRLRNLGPSTATNVAIEVPPTGVINRMPESPTVLPPFGSVQFFVAPSFAHPVPGEITVTCDELDGPIVVPMPAAP